MPFICETLHLKGKRKEFWHAAHAKYEVLCCLLEASRVILKRFTFLGLLGCSWVVKPNIFLCWDRSEAQEMKRRRYLFHHPQQHFPTSSSWTANQIKQAQTGLTLETCCCLHVSLSSILACSNACNLIFMSGTGKTIVCEAEQGIMWWGSPVV